MNNKYNISSYYQETSHRVVGHCAPNTMTYTKAIVLGSFLAASPVQCTFEAQMNEDVCREQLGKCLVLDKEFADKLCFYNELERKFEIKKRDDAYDSVIKSITEQILSFTALSNDWDGFGALPVGVKNANMALCIISKLSPVAVKQIDDFYPEPNGTISMKWRNEFHERLSLSIGLDKMSYYVKWQGKTHSEYVNSVSIDNQEIDKLDSKIQKILCI